MSKILELREKRAKAWEAAKAFLDSKRGNDGLISAEDGAVYDKMEADIVNLGKEITRLERQEALEAELNKPVNMPLTGKPVNPDMDEKTGRASDEYKKALAASQAFALFSLSSNILFMFLPPNILIN